MIITIKKEHQASEAPEVGIINLSNFPLEVIPADVRAVVKDYEVLSSLEY
jgi:hypothetical protein